MSTFRRAASKICGVTFEPPLRILMAAILEFGGYSMEENYIIMTDSSADLSEDYVQQLRLTVLPLSFTMD